MSSEYGSKPGAEKFVAYARHRVEAVVDHPLRNIHRAARELADGQLVAWKLYTLGLIVDGTNPEALPKLFTAKGIDYQKAVEGKRPVVSVLPPPEYRDEVVAFDRHSPEVEEMLRSDERQLLTAEGNPLFYRVYAQDAPYLQPPLTGTNDAGEHTIVLLWHDNKHVRRFEQQARAYKFARARSEEERRFLLTGSSANPTGEKQPVLIARLDPSVRQHTRTSVDLQDRRIHRIEPDVRGAIPIIDLTSNPPRIMRQGMYPAVPVHEGLQKLLQEHQPRADAGSKVS
jgi:tRNA A37 threonylcarbamoyladenosine synthetase subunit TsaC/SUA5/YrdC